jgi:hypothetical protein
MSFDLLHAGPMFLVSFTVAAAALLLLLVGLRRGAVWTWRVVAAASLIAFLLGIVQQGDMTTRGLLWTAAATLWLVTIPVVIGARALARWKLGLATSPALVYAGAVLVGVGAGWILLPIALGLTLAILTAVRS